MRTSHLLDVYSVRVHLATTRKDWAKLRKKLGIEPLDVDCHGLTQHATWRANDGTSAEQHVLVYLDVRGCDGDPRALVNVAAHEATHAATMLLRHYGHKIRGHDEPHAYLVGWLTEWLWTHASPELAG